MYAKEANLPVFALLLFFGISYLLSIDGCELSLDVSRYRAHAPRGLASQLAVSWRMDNACALPSLTC